MLAIWTTIVLIVSALAAAMTLTWRRWTKPEAQPCRVEVSVERCGCYPKVRR